MPSGSGNVLHFQLDDKDGQYNVESQYILREEAETDATKDDNDASNIDQPDSGMSAASGQPTMTIDSEMSGAIGQPTMPSDSDMSDAFGKLTV